MKILKFNEINELPDLCRYKIIKIDKNGETYFNDVPYDPYDLEDAVKILMKFEKKYNLIIKKFSFVFSEWQTGEIVDKETIDKIKIWIDSEKYNL
jgi:hypothetical protein